jgi:hypothetical protein
MLHVSCTEELPRLSPSITVPQPHIKVKTETAVEPGLPKPTSKGVF